MDPTRINLLSIGEFARASMLSLKALRLYDELAILKPSYVDPQSAYRYYAVEQLPAARLIRLMRQMDMPLITIRQVLSAAPAQAETLVQEYWQGQEQRMERARRLLQDLILSLRKETHLMKPEVQVKSVAPLDVISITRRVKIDGLLEHINGSIQQLLAHARAQGCRTSGPPFGLYHGPVNAQDDGPMEVCLPLQEPAEPQGEIETRRLPGGQVAFVRLSGEQCDFPAILEGYDAVWDWIQRNGYETAEPPREVYLSEPGEPDLLEVAWLFREAVPEAEGGT
jgi:DNA-binding transcriptional MerR regulator